MNIYADKPKFDALKFNTSALSYAKHGRLMLLMLAFGALSGIVAYVFAIPTYRSTALVSVQGYGAPVVDRDIPETNERSVFNREFLNRIRSSRVQLAAAQNMGLLAGEATSEDLLDIIPSLIISPVDIRNLEITMLAYDPAVVRTFVKELVVAYQELQQESYDEYRDEAMRRYTEQVARLEAEIAETVKSLTSVERDQNLTEAMLEQQSLLEIPKQLIQTREQLARMKGIKTLLDTIENQAETPGSPSANAGVGGSIRNMISLLSLLGSFEDETEVNVGDVIPSTRPQGSSVIAKNKETTNTIVSPGDVEAIEPWRKLERELRILTNQIKQNSGIYLPGHRVMKDLEAKLDATERALESEFRMLRQKFDLRYGSLEEKKKRLEARMPEYHAITEQVGKSSQEYSTIVAKQQMWDESRERLAEKLATITFSEEFDWIDLRYKGLISLREDIPISPNKTKIAMVALVIGVAGAFGLPTMLNMLDTSASTIIELERLIGISGIGIVPLTPKGMLEDVARSPSQGSMIPNYLLECFRVIRANIVMHPNRDNKSQVVLVTSARPQEGKTSQASNLAWAFQSMGEKTLLLDCDLRRGRIHVVLDINKAPGLTRLMLGECTKEEAIKSAGPGAFDVITRGPVIAGTTDLLCQGVFHDLLQEFRKTYDRIVIDAPPCLGLSETTSLQEIVDGTVLVVRAESTGRKDVMEAVAMLRRCNGHFFGFVLNAVDLSKLSNYYNYYYYSATYYDQFEEEVETARPAASRI